MEILKKLPTELYSDEPQLETDLHLRQIILLLTSLEWYWGDRQDFFASGNITIYYSPHQKKIRSKYTKIIYDFLSLLSIFYFEVRKVG